MNRKRLYWLIWKFAEKIHNNSISAAKIAAPSSRKANKLPGKAVEIPQKLLTSWKGCGFPGKPRYSNMLDSFNFKKKRFLEGPRTGLILPAFN